MPEHTEAADPLGERVHAAAPRQPRQTRKDGTAKASAVLPLACAAPSLKGTLMLSEG